MTRARGARAPLLLATGLSGLLFLVALASPPPSSAQAGGDTIFTYGNPGDIAVVGDWDGNGSDTPGVVRYDRWYLNNQQDGSAPERAFIYGNPGDIAVVGDWDGNGTDSPGVKRSGRWYLNNQQDGSVPERFFTYGNPGDIAVVGDWDGNGSDSPGVERSGRWYLNTGAPASDAPAPVPASDQPTPPTASDPTSSDVQASSSYEPGEAEKWFCGRPWNYKRCLRARSLGRRTVKAQVRLYGKRRAQIPDGRADAFRHCYWSALMTWDLGASFAKSIGDAHEYFRGNMDSAMDLWNNFIGRRIALNRRLGPRRAGRLASACARNARPGGELIVTNRPGRVGESYW